MGHADRYRLGVVIIGLFLAYLPYYGGEVLEALGPNRPSAGPFAVVSLNWVAVGLLLLFVIAIERRPLASLLLTKPTEKDIEWAFYLWGTAMTWYWLASTLVPPGTESDTTSAGTDIITAQPVWRVLILVVTVAVCEEILIRGYAAERIWASPL